MIPPLNIPAIAPFKFVRFQNNANSVNGPKAPPNPAHAFSTNPNTELFSSIAIKTPINAITIVVILETNSTFSSDISFLNNPWNKFFDTQDDAIKSCESDVLIVAACGTLFNSVFGLNYQKSMIVCAIVIVLYTSMGGFLAASTTDLIQGLLMSFAIVIVLIVGVVNAGGVANVIAHGQAIEGFFDVMKYHDPCKSG